MPLPGNRESTPFKTMDIKTALISSGNRKRKATSPQMPKSEPKNVKLNVENCEYDSDVIVLDGIRDGITLTVDQNELESNLGDCKENKDINAAKSESSTADCKENKLLHTIKDELSPHVNKTSCNGALSSNPVSPKSSQSNSDVDIDCLSESKLSDNSSCDELNTRSVSLNTSGLSVTGEDEKGNNTINSDINYECGDRPKKGMEKNETKERTKKKKMTPAEAQKRAEERERMQKERLLKKQELENKKKERLLEKERKIKEKQVRKEREELERKERERLKQEKKEQEEKERQQKQKEKEEKLKMKQIMLEQKMEEKKKKEEIKQKREEELKKAEEEKLKAKLEKEQKDKEKMERAKASFLKFFVKDAHTSAPAVQVAEKEGAFLPFQVSDSMILAPVIPAAARKRFNKKQLDHYLEFQDGKELYLEILKLGSYNDVRQKKKNRKLATSDADILVINTNAQAELGLCPKLLQFCENVRPPYWGTWRKKSKSVHPRNPFGQDEIFDYSVDSDDEWDEGGPGESLSGTEQEDESEDDYDIDNEFFVPHGYLSDEEEQKEDDDEEVNDPEKQKAILKLKLQEFEMERKKKTTELKPIILGCYFVNLPAFQDSGLHGLLEVYSAIFLSDNPIPTSFSVKNQQLDSGSNMTESPKLSSSGKKKKILLVPDEAFPQLILLVHGNVKKRRILAEEFQKFWFEQYGESQEVRQEKQETDKSSSNTETDPSKEAANDLPSGAGQISLRQLMQTIREIASYGKPPESSVFNKYCWWVHDAVREKYGMMDAPIPNRWKYVSQKEPEPQAKVNCPSIKEFLSTNPEK